MPGSENEEYNPSQHIPPDVWSTDHVYGWYTSQRRAGHRLREVRAVEWVKRVGRHGFPLFVAMHVAVSPEGEGRVKDNETVITRPSTSHVLVWSRGASPEGDRFLLIQEYRTTAMNAKGFVYELPGGSSFKPGADPAKVARHELRQETGLELDAARFVPVGIAQAAPTMVANRAFLMRVELSTTEMDALAGRDGEVHGLATETERTYIRVFTRAQVMDPGNDWFGWETRGMIATGAV